MRRYFLAGILVSGVASLAMSETPPGHSSAVTWGSFTHYVTNSNGVVTGAGVNLDAGADAGGNFTSDPIPIDTWRQVFVDCAVTTASSCSATVPVQLWTSDNCDGGIGWFPVNCSNTFQALTGGSDGGVLDCTTSGACVKLVAEGMDGGGGIDGGELSCSVWVKGI
jgi:hypothetical protein